MRTALERFMAKVDTSGDCWIWKGRVHRSGYGVFDLLSREVSAHRFAYESLSAPIPEGLTLDHLCHTRVAKTCTNPHGCLHRRCVNPAHLEPVTRGENMLRGNTIQAANASKTECMYGHPFSPENTNTTSTPGKRSCRTCKSVREWYRKRGLRASETDLRMARKAVT